MATANETKVKMSTSPDENSESVETELTIKWDSPDAERTFATRGVKIAAQSILRALGDIPTSYTVTVSELAKRERGGFSMKPTAANANRLMAKLPDDEYRAALVSMGVAPRDVERIVKNRVHVTVMPGKNKSGPVTITQVQKKK